VFIEKKTREAIDFLRRRGIATADRALALESGMVGLSNELSHLVVVPYKKIPYFPFPQGENRRGLLLFGALEGRNVFILEGRGRLFEGYFHRELAFPLRVLAGLGLKKLVLAAGVLPLGEGLRGGETVIIEDHIDLTGGSPLRGLDPPASPPRLDPCTIYSPALREKVQCVAREQGVDLRRVVAACLAGPTGPTPAERSMLVTLGADVVTLSLSAEVMMALHLGVETVALGLVTTAIEGGAESGAGGWGAGTLEFFKTLLGSL